MVKLQKLEKVVFGGIKGRMYTEQVFLLHSEFQRLCKGITGSEYDPLDLTSKVLYPFKSNKRFVEIVIKYSGFMLVLELDEIL